MARPLRLGDCVRLTDGRIGRVRGMVGEKCRVRVRRKTSDTHEFVLVAPRALQRVPCPKGWMSEEGYRRYLRVTLAKMRRREAAKRSTSGVKRRRDRR